jgi:hypothetical protein
MNRKELTVFVQTTDEDTELSISTTRSGVVVLTLPNGIKVGVDPQHLMNALYDLKFFKQTPSYEIVETSQGSSVLTIGEAK